MHFLLTKILPAAAFIGMPFLSVRLERNMSLRLGISPSFISYNNKIEL